MGQKRGSNKRQDEGGQAEPDLQRLKDAARAAFAFGDYRHVRLLNKQIVELAGAGPAAQEAAAELLRLKVDPLAIGMGLGTLALYGLSWLVVLS